MSRFDQEATVREPVNSEAGALPPAGVPGKLGDGKARHSISRCQRTSHGEPQLGSCTQTGMLGPGVEDFEMERANDVRWHSQSNLPGKL
jgi:hypothetical protein